MLKVDVQRIGDTVTVLCTGRLVFGMEAEVLDSIVCRQACRTLLLDLKRVQAIDARGLGVLVSVYRWARQNGIFFAVVNASPTVSRLVKLVRINTVVPVCTMVPEARQPEAPLTSKNASLEVKPALPLRSSSLFG